MDAFKKHQSRASKSRWAKMTPEQRSAHAKMMVEARERKRQSATVPESESRKGQREKTAL